MKLINISIVVYCNPIAQIQMLLDDLNKNMCFINKIYIVDNSDDDKLKIIEGYCNNIEYIKLSKNVGYGCAHNVAIQMSIRDGIAYHVVVNPDIRLSKDVLSMLREYMDENLDVGLVMPDIRYPDRSRQHLCKLLPTPISLFSRRFLPKAISREFDRKYNLLDIDYSQEMNVPLLSGCFMFLRTSVLLDVGMFDPRFFMYLEDFDLVRRIHAKYKTIFLPSVKVTHEYAKGSYKNRKLMIYHIKSAIKYFNKYGWILDFHRRKINQRFLAKYSKK